MQHNPISMGDLAYSEVDYERSRNNRLQERVDTLEAALHAHEDHINLLTDLINTLLDSVYGAAKPFEITNRLAAHDERLRNAAREHSG